MDDSGRIIFVWPDGCWMDADEHSDVLDAWRGTDFAVMSVPSHVDDDAVAPRWRSIAIAR